MGQERVSFKVAKAIKEAGYPQFSWDIAYNSFGVEIFNEVQTPCYAVAPTYLDVWLWLQRDKNMYLIPEMKNYKFRCRVRQKPDGKPYFPPEPLSVSAKDNMEDAIIVAIDYLVDNDLIK